MRSRRTSCLPVQQHSSYSYCYRFLDITNQHWEVVLYSCLDVSGGNWRSWKKGWQRKRREWKYENVEMTLLMTRNPSDQRCFLKSIISLVYYSYSTNSVCFSLFRLSAQNAVLRCCWFVSERWNTVEFISMCRQLCSTAHCLMSARPRRPEFLFILWSIFCRRASLWWCSRLWPSLVLNLLFRFASFQSNYFILRA